MKFSVCAVLSACLFVCSAGAVQIPDTSAAAAVLMDADSGRILYAKNTDEQRLIASITKLMTALVALESGHSTDEQVDIKPEWTGIEGSSVYLRAGETVRLETLLYGMLLRSGNDAAQAVAGYCGGDVDAFVTAMNKKAVQLGMTNSHFANPSGLNAPEHYSTARDMAILARACLENDTLKTMVSTRSIALDGRIFTNHNKLLWQYEGCVGLKTGYTEKAGRTLVSAAEQGGMTLICVTLNDPNDWRDHAALFDYGFSRYERRCLIAKGDLLCRVPVRDSLIPFMTLRAEESVYAALTPEENAVLSLNMGTEILTAPIVLGTEIGEGTFSVNGEAVAHIRLLCNEFLPTDIAPKKENRFQIFGR